MCYESPVEVIASQMRITSEIHMGNEIVKAVQKVGVNVNKAELLKALAYDREQYEKGYADRDKEIIRCKDCKYGIRKNTDISNMYECGYPYTIVQESHFGDFFCALAEPKEGEQE